jgi:hypothetical protein
VNRADAKASIASRALRIVTIRETSLHGHGTGYAPDLYFCKAEYFVFSGLTPFLSNRSDLPVGPVLPSRRSRERKPIEMETADVG